VAKIISFGPFLPRPATRPPFGHLCNNAQPGTVFLCDPSATSLPLLPAPRLPNAKLVSTQGPPTQELWRGPLHNSTHFRANAALYKANERAQLYLFLFSPLPFLGCLQSQSITKWTTPALYPISRPPSPGFERRCGLSWGLARQSRWEAHRGYVFNLLTFLTLDAGFLARSISPPQRETPRESSENFFYRTVIGISSFYHFLGVPAYPVIVGLL